MTTLTAENASIWRAGCDSVRPPEDLDPDQFAAKHRVLHAIYCVENPGPWPTTVFPYQPDAMNCVKEAITTGKRGIAFMKAGQIGGSDCMINGQLWLKLHYPGPQLFMTSTDKVAMEFGRERFELIIQDMAPLKARYIPSARGEILVKRFTDGKIVLCGGQSVFNLQSSPYRVVTIDELDSLLADLGGSGDPLKLAEVRTDSFQGETLIIAYAHPSMKGIGAGKLYYELSDQRRAHIKHSCGGEFWINWFDPAIIRCVPRLVGQTQEQASRDPDCYHMHCPRCNARISESERVAMLRSGVKQKSVLPPEEAAKKAWIGIHASQFYTPAKSMRSFAERYIAALGDENAMRVFVNKVCGDVYEPKVKSVDLSSLRQLAVVKRRTADPEFYSRGQVPPGVLFLTGGQDSRSTQLHFAIWGWGVRETIDKRRELCGWLIDWGEIERQYSLVFNESEFHVFDDLIYRRRFRSTIGDQGFSVRACAHDIGYQPTQIPLTRYCRSWPGRAFPARGAAETATSASRADYVRMGAAKKFKVGDVEEMDDGAMLFNSYLLKTNWYGFVDQRIEIADKLDGQIIGTRKVPILTLPEDVSENWLEQSKNEFLGKGKKSNEMVWGHSGPNHLADCNTYAYGSALYLDPFAKNLTAEEYGQRKIAPRTPPRGGGGSGHDAAMG